MYNSCGHWVGYLVASGTMYALTCKTKQPRAVLNYYSCRNNVSRHTPFTCTQCNVPIKSVVNNSQNHVEYLVFYQSS